MKKIITLFICAVFTISTFAQEKKEPTKKETFDFIVKMISKGKNFSVKNYDYDTSKINYEYQNRSWIKYEIKLIDLIDVSEGNNNAGYYHITLKFKTNILEEEYVEGRWIKSRNNYSSSVISFEDKSDANKMRKALLHFIKLNGGSSDSFFDD